MLWPTIAWSTGLASGIGSSFIINSLPWRYAPPMGMWLAGLWLNDTSYGLPRRAAQGAIWGGGGGVVGLVGYDVWKLLGGGTAPQPKPNTETPPGDTGGNRPAEVTLSSTPSNLFMNPPRVAQGYYPTRNSWWRNT